MQDLKHSLHEWLNLLQQLLGSSYVGTYSIGSYETNEFNNSSDIDLITVIRVPKNSINIPAVRKLEYVWNNSHRLEVHYLWLDALRNDDYNDEVNFQLATLLSWQGKHLHGETVTTIAPDVNRTMIFNALKIIGSFSKISSDNSQQLLNDIFYALEVLDSKVNWEEAISRNSIAQETRPPSSWNLEEAKKRCQLSSSAWNIPPALKKKLLDLTGR